MNITGLQLSCLINGVYQSLASSISITTNAGLQRIDTLEGLSGWTAGSGDTTIAINSAVGIGGLEFDSHSAAANKEDVQIQINMGKKTYVGIGKIQDTTTNMSTNANVENSFNWTGELKALD